MNLVDLFIILIIGICVLEGIYKGFIYSLLSIVAFFISWLAGMIFYPALANSLNESQNLLSAFITYVEGSDSLGKLENAKLAVSSLSPQEQSSIIDNANFPNPFPELIKQNVENKAFEAKNLTTLGEYTNETLAIVIINIICFIAIFLIARVAFSFLINGTDRVMHFPMLKQFDSLLGGGFALINGVLILFVIFAFVPTFMAIQPIKIIQQYFDSSILGSFFYKTNFILNSIRGVL